MILRRGALPGALLLAMTLLPFVGPAQGEEGDVRRKRPVDRAVMFVGNNWGGTSEATSTAAEAIVEPVRS